MKYQNLKTVLENHRGDGGLTLLSESHACEANSLRQLELEAQGFYVVGYDLMALPGEGGRPRLVQWAFLKKNVSTARLRQMVLEACSREGVDPSDLLGDQSSK